MGANTKISVSGVRFPDGTTQTSATLVTGPTGSTGPTGPTGPTGSSGYYIGDCPVPVSPPTK